MAEPQATFWLIVLRDLEDSEAIELHPTHDAAIEKAKLLRDQYDKPGQNIYVVEVPVIWPA